MGLFDYTNFNRPRITPYNPNSEDIVLPRPDDAELNIPPGSIPIRPTFQGSAPMQMPEYPAAQNATPDESIEAKFKRLYPEEHQNIDRLNSMIDNAPERNNPGLARKIFAGFAQGLGGGPRAREDVLYHPYNNQMADWQAKMKPVEAAANLERQNNANMRMVANQILSQEGSESRLQRQIDRDKVLADQGGQRIQQGQQRVEQGQQRVEQGQERVDIAQGQLDLQKELANGGVLHVDDKGDAYLITRKGDKKPVDANYLSAEQKSALRIKEAEAGAGARARATAANSKPRVAKITYDDPNNPGKTIEGSINLDTGEITPGVINPAKTGSSEAPKPVATAPVKTESEATKELGKSRALHARANTVRQSNPTWNKWITFDKAGNVQIQRPGIMNGLISGPSNEEYQKIYQAVFETAPTAAPAAPANTQAATSTTPAQNTAVPAHEKKPGKTYVRNPQGQYGWVPTNQVSQLGPGYQVID